MFTGRSLADQILNFQQAGFERAQECEQAARGEVHVPVAQATEMSGAEMRTRMGAHKHQVEQTWTSHPVILLNEMTSCACAALENQGRSVLSEATAAVQMYQKEYQQSVRRHVSEAQQEVQVQQVASREEVDMFRHELSQSLAEGSHCEILFTTNRSNASERSSEIQQLRQERDY